MSENKVGTLEATCLIISIIINHIILNLPRHILSATGSASIINIIYVGIIALFFALLVCKLLEKFPGLDVFDIAHFLGGKWLKALICFLFIAYLLFTTSIFLRSFCENLKIIYFPKTPIAFIVVLFTIAMVIMNKLGIKPIFKTTVIILPVVLFSIIFIFFANLENFTFQRMFPLLGEGAFTTFFSGLSNLFAFSGLACLYLLPPYISDTRHLKRIVTTSVIISLTWLIFSIGTLLFIFPYVISIDQIFPLYLAARFIEFGRFFQRLDAIFLLIWVLSIACYLSALLYFITNSFKRMLNLKNKKPLVYAFGILVFSISLIPNNSAQIYFLENGVYKTCAIILLFGIGLPVLIMASIKQKIEKKHGITKTD